MTRHNCIALARLAVSFVTVAALAPANAAVVNPTSYSMINGGVGVFQYMDDVYTGTDSGGFLSGGVGELTDGVIATGPWFTTPGPYVGWRYISPEITFNFAGAIDLASAKFFFDDAKGSGGVFLPDSLSFDFGSGFQLGTPTVTTLSHLGVYTYDFTGVTTSSFVVRIDSALEWVMLTEVDFDGTPSSVIAVPEPASWAMMLGGFGLVGAALRRQVRSVANIA